VKPEALHVVDKHVAARDLQMAPRKDQFRAGIDGPSNFNGGLLETGLLLRALSSLSSGNRMMALTATLPIYQAHSTTSHRRPIPLPCLP